jgi:Amt family ammonium transporter
VGPLAPGLGEVTMGEQAWVLVQGVLAVVAWSAGVTLALVMLMGLVMNLRVKPEAETEGLDVTVHGERGYHTG